MQKRYRSLHGIIMKHKEYQQKRAALDDAYLFGEITLSDYARDSQNLDLKYHQIKNDNKINKEYKKAT